MTPGFVATPATNTSFKAQIDLNIINDVEITNSNTVSILNSRFDGSKEIGEVLIKNN